MKKLLTREQQAKKKQRNQLTIGIILIALMLFSTAGYALSGDKDSDTSEKITYNNIVFSKDVDYWYFSTQGINFAVKYNPEEIKSISPSINLNIQDYSNKPLYFVGDSQEPLFELKRNLYPFVLRISDACLNENCSGNFPVKNCSDDNIIIIKENIDNQERINQENKCVYITASQENQTMYADAVLFKLLEI